MKTSNNKFLSKINEIRMLYIETNNVICESIDNIATSFIKKMKECKFLFLPKSANLLKQKLLL